MIFCLAFFFFFFFFIIQRTYQFIYLIYKIRGLFCLSKRKLKYHKILLYRNYRKNKDKFSGRKIF